MFVMPRGVLQVLRDQQRTLTTSRSELVSFGIHRCSGPITEATNGKLKSTLA